MNEFVRKLSGDALVTLEALASAPHDNWWKELLRLWTPSGSGPGLRLAIRDNTIDFYRHGNRVAHVVLGKDTYVETHIKYVRGEAAGDRLLKLTFKDGIWAWNDGGPDVSFETIKANIDARMATLREKFPRKGLEKKGVDAVVGGNATVIDLEMGLPRDPALSLDDSGAPRIDLVALERFGEEIRIVFWEAKTLDDPRLRIDDEDKPSEVITQLKQYGAYLLDSDRQEKIIKAYRETCRLLAKCAGMIDDGSKPLHLLVAEAAKEGSNLRVDVKPRLMIFGKKNGKNADEDPSWTRHKTKIVGSGFVPVIKNEAAEIKLPAVVDTLLPA